MEIQEFEVARTSEGEITALKRRLAVVEALVKDLQEKHEPAGNEMEKVTPAVGLDGPQLHQSSELSNYSLNIHGKLYLLRLVFEELLAKLPNFNRKE